MGEGGEGQAVGWRSENRPDVSVPSRVRSATLRRRPPAYPVRLPFEPTTRWHGMMSEMGLWPTAPPTAWAELDERPWRRATSAATAAYVVVVPYGIASMISLTRARNGVEGKRRGGVKSGRRPLK